MPEIVRIKVEVDQRSNATISQIVGLKKTIDEINATHINVQVDNANQLEQVTRKMTAYNNSVARRAKYETQLATAIEYRKAEESRAQAQHERTRQSEERTIQTKERTIQAEQRTAQAKERTRQAEEKTAQAKERTAQVTERARLAQERANVAAKQGATANNLLNNSLTGLVTRFVSLQMLLSRTVSAFRDALQTMKDVDSALVTIQKTTGFTGQQLDKLTNSAYELANAYGRTATEILNAAAIYARAGFKDNLDQMTELSALLQNVGDLEESTASKFLIATNAAWKLNGSYDALMGVIDGLNAQTNQAAVDMEGLTSGITVAGSVFASAGESVQTFAGMLGAGIALTARSGSEVGRGLRTIAMNIRQIKGELDDGEIIDEESISDAAAALHSVGISVADANGELRLTSDVLNELAGRWNTLTTAEQSYLAQSLAGKRQANILISLMQNWDEAQRQMELYANGAGSALKENEIYMDSWEAKSKQLQASWTKFVNNLVDTKLIKGALDALIKIVDFLDSKFGRLVITSAGVGVAIVAIVGTVTKLTAAIAALNGVMAVNPIFLAAAGITAGIYLMVDAFGAIETESEKLAKKAEETQSAYEAIHSEVVSLAEKEEELTAVEQKKLDLLKEQERIKREDADRAAKAAALANYQNKYSGTLEASGYMGTYLAFQRKKETASRDEFFALESAMHSIEERVANEGATQRVKELISEYNKLASALKNANPSDELKRIERSAEETYDAMVDMAVELTEVAEVLGDDMPYNGRLALDMLTAFITQVKSTRGELVKTAEDAGRVTDALRERLKSLSDKADDIDTAIAGVTDALNKYGASSVQVYDAMVELEKAIPGSTDKLYDFETATVLSKDALDADRLSLLDLIDANKQVDFQNAIDQMTAVADAAWNMWAAEAMAYQGLNSDDMLRAGEWFNGGINASINSLIAQREQWDAYISTLRERSDYRSSSSTTKSSSSSSASTTDPELERLKNIVTLRKQELSFLKESGASQDEINQKQKDIQGALHDEAEYLRLSEAYLNGDEKALAEVLALSTEWWQIQKQIDDTGENILQQHKDNVALLKSELDFLKASGKSDEEIIAKQREIQNALHEQADYMRSIDASQTEINALSTEWWNIENDILSIQEAQLKASQELFDTLKKTIDEYYDAAVTDKEKELECENKILEVQKAQVALANAQKERNVRYFNAASGQWEWAANAKNVQSAKDALKKAQEDLNTYQKEQAWKEYKDAWEYVADQIKAGAMTFAQAYDYMEREMKRLQDKYNVDMSGVLRDSIGGFKGVNKTIKDLDAKTADELSKAVGLISKQNELMSTAVFDAKGAVKNLKDAYDLVIAKVKSGEMSFEDAYVYLKSQAEEIAETYGVDMTKALDDAIAQMAAIYSGLDGLKAAVEEGALTSDEAFDIISTALNAVSTQYGEKITEEVNRILAEENGFVGGLEGLADAVRNGQISVEDAFGYIEDATQKVSDKYGVDMTDALNTAIQKMGMSSDALDDLWKSIVMNQMRMNSVSWLELDEQEKKARASGDTATADAIKAQKEQLHAENEALGETIGATYDKSGYWSLNGNTLYDPNADRESGAFSGGGGGGFASTGITGVNPSGLSYGIGGIDGELPTDVIGKGQKRYFIPGYGFMNTSLEVANLLTPTAGRKGDEYMTAQLINYGTDAEIEEYFRTHQVPASFASNYDTIWKYNNGIAMSEGELNAADANIAMTQSLGIARNVSDVARQTGSEPKVFKETYDLPLNVVWSAIKDVGSQNADTYDSGGVLHGIGGIKATAQDEMVLPPDITHALLSPVSNGLVSSRLNDIRMWLGMKPEAGTVGNSIGTQNNGDNYIMNGVSIGEQAARSTTVYDLAHIARNLGAYQRS